MLMNGNAIEFSLYFHIPFCTRKCDYCHFYVLPDKDPFKKLLMQGLKQEWLRLLPVMHDKIVRSIYFGGGTPALLGAEAISEILSWIKPLSVASDLEITLEANPENITLDLMRSYAQAGINRVSIGIQTLNDALLVKLGRLHSSEKAINAILQMVDAGISNISIDLMYDLPGQTLEIWQSTLLTVGTLPIQHLSLYNLTIEPHTAFFKHRNSISKLQPDQETSLQMYESAIELLNNQGLIQYEVSAFAKSNQRSIHNVGYWTGRPFLGLGPSAFSYWEGKRFRNIANLNRYCKNLEANESPIDFEEKLSPDASRRELLAIHLRLLEGVHLENFQAQYGAFDSETLETLKKLQQEGFITNREKGYICLSKQGLLFYDTVASELI